MAVKIVSYPGFLGMNNAHDKARLQQPTRGNSFVELEEIINAEVTKTFSIRRRQGVSLVYPGVHRDLWSNGTDAYFVSGSNLMRLLSPIAGVYSAVPVCELTSPTLPMSYCQVNDVTVCSNGADLFIIDGGVAYPFPVPTDNFKERALPGHILAVFNRRLFIAVGNVLYYTDADNIEQLDERDDPFAFSGQITMVKPLENGIYVSADATYWLAGRGPDDFVLKQVDDRKAIKGSDVVANAAKLGISGVNGNVAIWATASDVLVGMDGGIVDDLTKGRLDYSVGEEASGGLVERDGNDYYIVTI